MGFRDCLIKVAVAVAVATIPKAMAFADTIALPDGWRMPTKTELGDDWRTRDADKFSVVAGDFNGDGVTDKALLLVSRNGRRAGVYVFLSENGGFKPYALDVRNSNDILPAMGVTKVAAGRYKTACGKGYWACKKSEPSELLLQNDAVEYFKTESASSYFYWNKRSKSFKRVWISD